MLYVVASCHCEYSRRPASLSSTLSSLVHGRCHPQTFRQAVHQSSMFPPSFVKDNEHKLMPFITQLFNRSNGVFLMQFKSPSLILSFWTHPKENPLLVILSQRTSCRYTQSIEHISEYIETISHCLIVKTRQPMHQALRCHVDLTLGHLPDQSWERRPGRPHNRWIDQLPATQGQQQHATAADLWRRSTTRGHTGVTLRSSTNYDDIGHKPYRPRPYRPQTKSATDHIGHSLCHIGHKQSPYRPQTTSTIDDRPTHSTNVL